MVTRRRVVRFLGAASSLTIVSACGNSDTASSADHAAARDSAGIRIVENYSQEIPSDKAWSVSLTPSLEIGANRRKAAGTDPERLRSVEEQISKLPPFLDTLPAYRRIRVDREGMLWVQAYKLIGESQVTWSVFNQGGRWQPDVSVPLAWQISDIGNGYILTIETDSLDVERVRKYRLTRGG